MLHAEVTSLVEDGPTDDEVNSLRRRHLREIGDDLTGAWQADVAAAAALRGEEGIGLEELTACVRGMTVDSLTPTLADLAATFIASTPEGADVASRLPFDDGVPVLAAVADGTEFVSARHPLSTVSLVIGDGVVELRDRQGRFHRASLTECVALAKFADGGRLMWSASGDSFRVEPNLFRDGARAVAELDRRVDPAAHIELPPRSPDMYPAVPQLRIGDRLTLLLDTRLGYFSLLMSMWAIVVLVGWGLLAAGLVDAAPAGLLFSGVVSACTLALVQKRPKGASPQADVVGAATDTTLSDESPPLRASDPAAFLLSRTCTRGWWDWVHGELWITPEAIVRLRRRASAALRMGSLQDPLPKRADATLAKFQPATVRALHRGNRYLRLDDVASARLHRGITTDRLVIRTRGGKRHKLLWMKTDPAFLILRDRLVDEMPERLLVR